MKGNTKYSLRQWCEENNRGILLEEWDTQENLPKTIDNTPPYSTDEVKWYCKRCGRKWEQRIKSRLTSNGCSRCTRFQVAEKRRQKKLETTSLAITHPELLSEWDYEGNSESPYEVLPGSHRKYLWKCPIGHSSYPCSIPNKTQGKGCPRCSGRIVVPGETDLASQYPYLAEEWDEKSNGKPASEVTAHNGHPFKWICRYCGSSFPATVANRVLGDGCTFCSDKSTSFPEQAIFYYLSKCFQDVRNREKIQGTELDVLIPNTNTAIEYDGVYWHKNKEGQDQKKNEFCRSHNIQLIRIRDEELPPVSGCMTIPCKDGSLKSLENALNQLFDVLHKSDSIKIDLAHDYPVILSQSKKRHLENSIKNTHPEIAKEWMVKKNNPLKIETITAGAGAYVWWKCSKCGNEWQAYVYSRTAGKGCEPCSIAERALARRIHNAEKKSLVKLYPHIAAEWDYSKNTIDINIVSAGSANRYYWHCPKGHESYLASPLERVDGHGCKACGRIATTKAACRAVVNLETGEVFESLDAAGKAYGGTKKSVWTACNNPNVTAYSFHWKYCGESTHAPRRKGKVINLDTGMEFDSFQAAADYYQSNRKSIRDACDGKILTAKGFHWKFVEA